MSHIAIQNPTILCWMQLAPDELQNKPTRTLTFVVKACVKFKVIQPYANLFLRQRGKNNMKNFLFSARFKMVLVEVYNFQ